MSNNPEAREGVGALHDDISSTENFVDTSTSLIGRKDSSTASVGKQLANTSIGNIPERRNSCSSIASPEQLKKRRREEKMEEEKSMDMEPEEQEAEITVIQKSSSDDLPDKYKVTRFVTYNW